MIVLLKTISGECCSFGVITMGRTCFCNNVGLPFVLWFVVRHKLLQDLIQLLLCDFAVRPFATNT